jgi:hypothetical protein
MSKQPIAGGQPAIASHDDLTRILGEVDDAKIVEILALERVPKSQNRYGIPESAEL